MTPGQLSHGQIPDAIDNFESTSKQGIPLSPSADKGVKGNSNSYEITRRITFFVDWSL